MCAAGNAVNVSGDGRNVGAQAERTDRLRKEASQPGELFRVL